MAADLPPRVWAEQPEYVEIWLEKDALASVLLEVTGPYDVPLFVTRGYASETFLYDAAQSLRDIHKPITICHLGDYDPSGRDAARDVRDKLRKFGAVFTFVELAVTEEQIETLQLPTRPTKTADSRRARWDRQGKGVSVELDAIPPNTLRGMVGQAIESHLDQEALRKLRAVEEQERLTLADLAQQL